MMKRNRLIFYSVFGVLHLCIFIFSIIMDQHKTDVNLLFWMQGKIWLLKYCSFILLILFATNVILHLRDNSRHTKEINKLNTDCDALKVKLYDQQQGKKS